MRWRRSMNPRLRRRNWEVVMAASDPYRDPVDHQEPALNRKEVLARYRRLREISKQHHLAIMKLLSRDALLRHARSLGLTVGKTLVANRMEELSLAYDLAIYTAPADRSRAVDRYARSAKFASGSDEALTLEAMCNARFSVISVKRRHPVAGLIVKDNFRGIELWLVDEGLETSLPNGTAFATRYFAPDRFAMTSGVGVPFDSDLLDEVVDSTPQLLRKPCAEAIGDRRFAEAVYRAAIADGVMEGLTYQDPSDVGNAA
jgi:hypothetical protein